MPSKKTKFFAVTLISLLAMVSTIPLAIWITHTSGAQLENARRRCQRTDHLSHSVVILNDEATPSHIMAHKCDILLIANKDEKQRLIAFGKHDSHISYDGVSEKLLSQGQNLKITLIKPGDYLFHDHAQPSVKGTFTVLP